MGRSLTLKVSNHNEELQIKLREKLTIGNLKAIIAKELGMSSVNMKLKLANAEVTWHKRLIDLGLKDGDILVAEAIKLGEQTEIAMDKGAAISGVEQR